MDENVGRLASKTAAHKLMQIMGLLVIPFAVLLALYVFKSKTEIDFLEQERAGVELALWVLVAPNELNKAQKLEFKQLEYAAGFEADSRPQRENVQYGVVAPDEKVNLLSYFAKIGRTSRVLADAEREVQLLAEVVFELVPSFASKLDELIFATSSASDLSSPINAQASQFLIALGALQTNLRSINDNLKAVEKQWPEESVVAHNAFHDAGRDIEVLLADVVGPHTTFKMEQGKLNALKQAASQLSLVGVKQFQNNLLKQIEQRLDARRSLLWRNLAVFLTACLASGLTSIGLAVLMMRSTFKHFDQIEIARNDADFARAEAESIALRFTSINADISRLNQDMALKVSQLKQAQDELIKKGRMEQLGQLIATIAHEIRNPLGAIRTTAFMVERKIAEKNLGLEGHLQRINNSVNRCDTIIAQLLDFSRTKEVHSSPLLLDDWLAKTVRDEAERLPENILIECSLGLEGETVNIDPSRMQRAIVNLLNNATEALTGQQDRMDGIHTPLNHHIWVSTKRLGDNAVIRIADNGPGIAAEYIQKIREPLFTTKSFGTGLGIPAVEQVINQHGGRLDISSDIGKGAVFSIHLPMQRRRVQAT